MAYHTEKQNGVFGGIKFNNKDNTNNEDILNTSFFEGEAKNTAENSELSNIGNNEIFRKIDNENVEIATNFQPITKENAIVKRNLWSKIRAFLFKEVNFPIKIQLTPYQQKVEDEINEFLHQEISFKSIAKLFSKKK